MDIAIRNCRTPVSNISARFKVGARAGTPVIAVPARRDHAVGITDPPASPGQKLSELTPANITALSDPST
jgi:hypothetical protein